MNLRTIVKNSAWIGVVQILNFGIPLFTLPVAARAFGPGTYGLIASLSASAGYAGLIITFGFNLTGPRLIARTPGEPDALSRTFSSIFLGQVAFAAVCLVVGTAALLLFGASWTLSLIGVTLLVGVVASSLVPMWMFVGLQSVREIVLSQLLQRVASAVLIVALIRRESDALLFVGINTAFMLVSAFSALLILRRKGIRVVATPLAHVIASVRGAGRLFVATVAINLYTTTNIVVVSVLLGPVAAGYFALADRVRGAVVGLFDPVSQSLYPYLCRTDAGESRERNKRLFFRALVALSLLAAVALYVASPLIAGVLGGERFRNSVPLLRILAVTPLLICLSNILGIQTMLPDDMERELSQIVSTAGIAGVFIVTGMTAAFGLEGAAWSYVMVETGVTVAMALYVRRTRSLVGLFFDWDGHRLKPLTPGTGMP